MRAGQDETTPNILFQGPIVRINPYEVHVNDPEFIDEIYVGPSRKTNKYPWSMVMFGSGTSAFSTTDHDLHRIRRAAVSSFFSTLSVKKLESGVELVISKAMSRLKESCGSGTPINLVPFYSALTTDIITQYAFGRSYDYLDQPGFAREWYQMWTDTSENSHFIKQFPQIIPLMENMPDWIVKLTKPNMLGFIKMQRVLPYPHHV